MRSWPVTLWDRKLTSDLPLQEPAAPAAEEDDSAAREAEEAERRRQQEEEEERRRQQEEERRRQQEELRRREEERREEERKRKVSRQRMSIGCTLCIVRTVSGYMAVLRLYLCGLLVDNIEYML